MTTYANISTCTFTENAKEVQIYHTQPDEQTLTGESEYYKQVI